MSEQDSTPGVSRRGAIALGGAAAGGLVAMASAASAQGAANLPPLPAPAPGTGEVGRAGDLHQPPAGNSGALTTNQGLHISDDQNSLKVGPRGPVLLEDFVLREKITHFDHERIPERVVHARGSAAHGYFELTASLANVSKAQILSQVGARTPVFARFSTVAGNKGSADLARDVRGFAVKFYSPEGNWDLVGNNIPVFFIQDAIKFPDLIHAAKDEPDRGFPQAQTAHDNFWDFISLTPESAHMIMWIMSDRAIPRSFRMMEGFGVHTFRLINLAGASTYVKFHWRPKLGMQSVVWDEALKINGADPDFHRRDLWNSIDQGDFPEWELGVQLFDEAFANRFEFDVLDATKLIPEELIPIKVIGRMVLNKNPDNFFAETEQVAFCTANVVPGIDFTNDPLLQGRNFSYLDTQLTRLGGPNFAQIPINRPRCPMQNFQRDGHMDMQVPTGRVNYEPNSRGANLPREDPDRGFRSFPAKEGGDLLRVRSDSFADHFSQARQFFMSQSDPERNHIVSALIFELSKVETPGIRSQMLSQLANIDSSLAGRVAAGLGYGGAIAPARAARPTRTNLRPSAALSILAKAKPTMQGRTVGCLVADGADGGVVNALRSAAKSAGANFKVVAPRVAGAVAADGALIPADFQLAGGPSVLFDAIAVVAAGKGANKLAEEAAAVAFVHDAFAHLKVIAFAPDARPLLVNAGVDLSDKGVVGLATASPGDFLSKAGAGRIWAREGSVRQQY